MSRAIECTIARHFRVWDLADNMVDLPSLRPLRRSAMICS
jgi:hypothetical protein